MNGWQTFGQGLVGVGSEWADDQRKRQAIEEALRQTKRGEAMEGLKLMDPGAQVDPSAYTSVAPETAPLFEGNTYKGTLGQRGAMQEFEEKTRSINQQKALEAALAGMLPEQVMQLDSLIPTLAQHGQVDPRQVVPALAGRERDTAAMQRVQQTGVNNVNAATIRARAAQGRRGGGGGVVTPSAKVFGEGNTIAERQLRSANQSPYERPGVLGEQWKMMRQGLGPDEQDSTWNTISSEPFIRQQFDKFMTDEYEGANPEEAWGSRQYLSDFYNSFARDKAKALDMGMNQQEYAGWMKHLLSLVQQRPQTPPTR